MKLTRFRFLTLAGVFATMAVLDFGQIGIVPQLIGHQFQSQVQAISLGAEASLLESAYELFDPSLQPYLRSVPIVASPLAQTAFEHTGKSPGSTSNSTFIAVSPDFVNKASDSKYWKDFYSKPPYNLKPDGPVFSDSFKLELIVHELFHVAGNYLKVDYNKFYSDVAGWYQSDLYGRPTPSGIASSGSTASNRSKYILWWDLYAKPGNPDADSDQSWKTMNYCDRYQKSTPGVEEFAYIGQAVLVSSGADGRKDRLQELSPALFDYYKGIINPDILSLIAVGNNAG